MDANKTNLMTIAHKSVSDQYRYHYDNIRWDHIKTPEEMRCDAIKHRLHVDRRDRNG